MSHDSGFVRKCTSNERFPRQRSRALSSCGGRTGSDFISGWEATGVRAVASVKRTPSMWPFCSEERDAFMKPSSKGLRSCSCQTIIKFAHDTLASLKAFVTHTVESRMVHNTPTITGETTPGGDCSLISCNTIHPSTESNLTTARIHYHQYCLHNHMRLVRKFWVIEL